MAISYMSFQFSLKVIMQNMHLSFVFMLGVGNWGPSNMSQLGHLLQWVHIALPILLMSNHTEYIIYIEN